MTDPHTRATSIATSTLQPVPQCEFFLVCAYCGDRIAVEGGSLAHHVRCPSCAHRVKVVRSASHTCEYCGARSIVDLTDGSTVAACDDCGRSSKVAAVVAPTLRRRRQRCRSHPRSGADSAVGLLPVAILILFLYALVNLSLELLGSGG